MSTVELTTDTTYRAAMSEDKKTWWKNLKARIGLSLKPYVRRLPQPKPMLLLPAPKAVPCPKPKHTRHHITARGGFYIGQRVHLKEKPWVCGTVAGFKDLSYCIKDDPNGALDFAVRVKRDDWRSKTATDSRNGASWEPE